MAECELKETEVKVECAELDEMPVIEDIDEFSNDMLEELSNGQGCDEDNE